MTLLVPSCREDKTSTRFNSVPSSKTNVTFTNNLIQNADFNIIEYLYFYNGGGVATGDFNNDGLTDLYFSSNQHPNKLYLNKGDFKFDDITTKAGVSGAGNWKTGVALADVNADGYLDIFLCGVGGYKKFNGRNQLLINNQDLTFSDRTDEYGLAFHGFSTHAAFFDYDNDGDLDMYLLNHSVHTSRSYGHSRLRLQSDPYAGDKLYRNDLIPDGKKHFTEVTSASGIYNSQIGYGLGIGISDLNADGYQDIYVSNDFHENDYFYINHGDGTFREQVEVSFPHVSRFSMGNDIADINNDGLPDIITLDMLPRDEEVIKTTAGEDPFEIYEFKLRFGYHHQFARNSLQLNRGKSAEGQVLFSDIAALAGVEASDWSWAPLLADFDNDGKKDLFVANGILTRPNDLDYINFISSDSAQRHYGFETFIKNMPSGKVPNVFFRNTGALRFADVSKEWIGNRPTLSTGAAYADLDNDGDLDLVLNNINEEASLLRNDAPEGGGWLQVDLAGKGANTFGIGAKLMVYAGGEFIYQEQMLSRGWQSSTGTRLHIGLGNTPDIDSLVVVWPDGKYQTLTSVQKNRRLVLHQKDATGKWDYGKRQPEKSLFIRRQQPPFKHRENDFNAFSVEKLIPHMATTEGPAMSVADINGDALEDFFVGGAAGQSSVVFVQHPSGEFTRTRQPALESDSLFEDVGSTIFDVDGNGTMDLVVIGGGQQYSGGHGMLRPRLYKNNGRGIFLRSKDDLPDISVDASCVKEADLDRDGDVDLFIGGRVAAGHYGINPESFILINDGKGNFSNGSNRLPGEGASGKAIGMVTDATWCDLNTDGRHDLLIAGEWMQLTVLIQHPQGFFEDKTREFGLQNTYGWWRSLEAGDFDGDGDMDFLAGNLGLNSRLRASENEPVTLYVGDIDRNGGTDHLLTYYNRGEEHPFISRDQLVKQVPSFKRAFLKYNNFRKVTREQIIPSSDTLSYAIKKANYFASVYLENRNGNFAITPLPVEAQMFPVFSFSAKDFNGDGRLDFVCVGNLYAVQPEYGRYDSGYGLLMTGDGKGNFQAVSQQHSGFLVRGEGRKIRRIKSHDGRTIILVGVSNDSLQLFESNPLEFSEK